MFSFLFTHFSRNKKGADTEYTPEMDGHPPIHDLSEGGEFLDDSLLDEDVQQTERANGVSASNGRWEDV